MLRSAIFFAFLAFLVYVYLFLCDRMDVGRHHHKHHPGKCSQVKGHTLGSENIVTTADGLVFITSGLLTRPPPQGLQAYYDAQNIRGRIYLFDFKQPEQGAKDLKLIPSKVFDVDAFNPHGVDILEDKSKGRHLVYVVNHPRNSAGETIEKFRYEPETSSLQHLRSIQDEAMDTINDLILVGEDKFYYTNFLYSTWLPLIFVEIFLPLRWGSIVFYDGKNGTVVHPDSAGPNGITMSADGRFVYVCEYSTKRLLVLERNAKDGSLTLRQTVELYILPDNANPTQDGSALLLGGHPIHSKMAAYLIDPMKHPQSPSSVLHLPLKDGLVLTNEMTEIFYDHGDLITASSAAANYGKNLLIGSVLNTLVYCETNIDF